MSKRILRLATIVLGLAAACSDARAPAEPRGMGGASSAGAGGAALDPDAMVEETTAPNDSGPEPEQEWPPCQTSAGHHDAASCAGACAFESDVELGCERQSIGELGVHVAVTASEASLFMGSHYGALELAAQGERSMVSPLPASLTGHEVLVAQAQNGSVFLAAHTDHAIYEGGILSGTIGGLGFFTRDAALGWAEESVRQPADFGALYDFAIDSGDVSRLWIDVTMPFGYRRLSRPGSGEWLIDITLTPGDNARWLMDGEGREISIFGQARGDDYGLTARVDGVEAPLGSVIGPSGPGRLFQPVRPAVPATSSEAPSFAVVFRDAQALHIAWPSDSEQGYDEHAVQASPWFEPSCVTPRASAGCNTECTDSNQGVDHFAAARTSDGKLWLVWTERQDDILYRYFELSCTPLPQGQCDCGRSVERDNSKGSLHVASFDFDSGSFTPVLSMPIAPAYSYGALATNVQHVDVAAFDAQLAIGLRLRPDPASDDATLRLLHLDTSAF